MVALGGGGSSLPQPHSEAVSATSSHTGWHWLGHGVGWVLLPENPLTHANLVGPPLKGTTPALPQHLRTGTLGTLLPVSSDPPSTPGLSRLFQAWIEAGLETCRIGPLLELLNPTLSMLGELVRARH